MLASSQAEEGAQAGGTDSEVDAGGGGLHLEVGIDEAGASVVRHLPPLPELLLRPGDDLPLSPTGFSQRHLTSAKSSLHISTARVDQGLVNMQISGAGLDENSRVVTSVPPFPYSAGAGAGAGAGLADDSITLAPPSLQLDSAYINIDELLLRSAAHVATAELLSLRTSLEASLERALSPAARALCLARLAQVYIPWTRGQVAGASREAAAASAVQTLSVLPVASSSSREAKTEELADLFTEGGHVSLACPELELVVDGRLVMTVSKNLFTGRLLVKKMNGLQELDMFKDSLKARTSSNL